MLSECNLKIRSLKALSSNSKTFCSGARNFSLLLVLRYSVNLHPKAFLNVQLAEKMVEIAFRVWYF